MQRDHLESTDRENERPQRSASCRRAPVAVLARWALALWVVGPHARAGAQDAAAYFRQNCASCHTIGGGRLTGPDLKDVTERQDGQWLQAFMLDPMAKIRSGDPYALRLLEEARGAIMPPAPGMTAAVALALLDLIEAESALDLSQFGGSGLPGAPFTAADVERGESLFRGETRLVNGGPNCISCHTTAGVGGLGGGHLGPDLTRAYERLQGRAGLTAWLSAPATVTMRAIYGARPLDSEEVSFLVAYLERQSLLGARSGGASQLNFLLLGLGGAALGLLVMDWAWRGRLCGVRGRMTREPASRGSS